LACAWPRFFFAGSQGAGNERRPTGSGSHYRGAAFGPPCHFRFARAKIATEKSHIAAAERGGGIVRLGRSAMRRTLITAASAAGMAALVLIAAPSATEARWGWGGGWHGGGWGGWRGGGWGWRRGWGWGGAALGAGLGLALTAPYYGYDYPYYDYGYPYSYPPYYGGYYGRYYRPRYYVRRYYYY
jgi:hypothetical protein